MKDITIKDLIVVIFFNLALFKFVPPTAGDKSCIRHLPQPHHHLLLSPPSHHQPIRPSWLTRRKIESDSSTTSWLARRRQCSRRHTISQFISRRLLPTTTTKNMTQTSSEIDKTMNVKPNNSKEKSKKKSKKAKVRRRLGRTQRSKLYI